MASVRVEVLRGRDAATQLRPDWEALFTDAPESTPFQSPAWQLAWFETLGSRRTPLLYAVREGHDLIGLMPMVRVRALWRTLRPAAVGVSDYLHPLARPDREQAVAQALREAFEGADADLVDLHQVRDDRAIHGELGGEESIPQATCLVLDLPTSYDAYLATLSKSLRYDVRRLERKGLQEKGARLEFCGPDRIDVGLDAFFDLHRRRWRRRGLPGAFLSGQMRFHRNWAAEAAERGELWLSLLWLEDRPVGALYAIRAGRTCFFYQSGFDPAASAVSPGTILVASTLKRAIEEGLTAFDFLRGDEPYKRRWQPNREHQNARILLASKGVAAQAGAAWNHAGSRVERRIRERLEGRGLIGGPR